MDESFYAALGVPADADREAIERAYRDRVKAHHPDVSDRDDADEAFRRLTTARDVLTDATERARYDRLGHADYVRRHVDGTAWTVPASAATAASPSASAPASRSPSTVASASSSASRSASATASTAPSAAAGSAGSATDDVDVDAADRAPSGSSPSRAGGTAADYYRTGRSTASTDADADAATSDPLVVLRAVGPWAIVHLVLLTSGLATAWIVMAYGAVSIPSVLLAAFLLAVVFVATVYHLSVKAATAR